MLGRTNLSSGVNPSTLTMSAAPLPMPVPRTSPTARMAVLTQRPQVHRSRICVYSHERNLALWRRLLTSPPGYSLAREANRFAAVVLALAIAGGCGRPTIRVANESDASLTREPAATAGRGRVAREGPNTFRAECPEFNRITAEQKDQDWCWAACAQMIVEYTGGPGVDQHDIVEKIRGRSDQKTARFDEVMMALNPDLAREWSALLFQDRVQVQTDRLLDVQLYIAMMSGDNIVMAISNGEPVILGLADGTNHHAVVGYAVTYSRADLDTWEQLRLMSTDPRIEKTVDQFGLESIEIFDPWPGVGSRELSARELGDKLEFIMSRREARLLLQALQQAVH